uniref:VWFA domain-containing protein n=1 Tax=Callorhinchus milii TaxID=7868 RepID=A0A4W3J1J8_CALMI
MKMHVCMPLLLVLGLMLSNITETQKQGKKELWSIKLETADLVFLIDGSNNVGRANFAHVRDFMVNFIENLDVGPDTIQIGVAQYSDDPSAEFYLNTYSTKTQVLDAVKGLQLRGGEELKTGAALQFLVDSYFTESAGSRAGDGVPQAVFLLTSKKSSDNIRQGVLEIKRNHVFTFVIGLGQADRAEVKLIATDPIFTAEFSNFQVNAAAQQKLLQMFSMIANRVIVLESVEMSPEVPINRKDIVFLIDGSASLGRVNFLQIRDFILSIVEKFEVGPDAVQVGLVQYSNNAKTEFYLNTFSTKAQVLGFIRRLRLKMGRPLNTGAALDYVFKTHFTSSAGSRKDKDIPQLLVLITAGKSKDDVKMPADTLKEASIMTLAIGGRNADLAELQKIAIDPSLVFNVKEFRSLPHVLETVMTPLSALTGVTRVEKRDIVFLVDGTLNFGHKNFAAIRGFVARIIGAQDIGSDRVRVGLVQYSDDAEAEFYLNTYSTKAQLLSKIKQLRPKGGRTLKTGAALDNVSRYLFTKSAGGRREEGVPQFLVHVAGGSSIDDTKQSSDALLRAGVMTLAVGVGNADQQRLSEIALDPSLGFYVKEFRSLPDIESESVADRRDIVFLVDGTLNFSHKNFAAIRGFVARIIGAQDIGSDRVRVGLVQYSDDAKTEPKGGRTLKTGAALDYVSRYLFTKSAGGRREEGVPQFLVHVAGGSSIDDTKQSSDALLRTGVMALAVGVGNADQQRLSEIALDPSLVSIKHGQQKYSLSLCESWLFSQLKTAKLTVVSSLDVMKAQGRDIVFLIDGSTKVEASFPSILKFLQSITQELNIGRNADQVGVVQYSDDPKVEFFMNTYSNKEDILTAVQRMRFMGGRALNTGKALDYVMRHIFTKPAGSRLDAGVAQMLVLLTSGKSRDDVKQAGEALKRAAIVTFVIGGMEADGHELQEIAYSSNLMFAVEDFQSLPDIKNQLLRPLKTLTVEIVKLPTTVTEGLFLHFFTVGNKRDVVFLIDGTSKVGTNFYRIRDFIYNLIQNFDVGEDKDRIGVVQYSDDARVEFPLNAYSNFMTLLDAVRRLGLKGGRTLNTGSALDFIMKNVLTKSAGSRRDLGITQILVLITTGKSQDEVRLPSEILKRAGVVTFTVGINEADNSELHQIAYSPKLIFQVNDYWDLSDLDLQLLTVPNPQMVQCATNSRRLKMTNLLLFCFFGGIIIRRVE